MIVLSEHCSQKDDVRLPFSHLQIKDYLTRVLFIMRTWLMHLEESVATSALINDQQVNS